jgi:Uma2 family endonuclease
MEFGTLELVVLDPDPTLRHFTRHEVLRMAELGILREGERVELLRGRLIAMSPQGPQHTFASTSLRDRLLLIYGAGAVVREDKPLDCGTEDLPEPDLAVVRGIARDYVARHPAGAEALLVVEIAQTSQRIDREKAAIYASAQVPVYWLLDVAARRLEEYTNPTSDGRYALARVLDENASVTPPGAPAAWKIAALLP